MTAGFSKLDCDIFVDVYAWASLHRYQDTVGQIISPVEADHHICQTLALTKLRRYGLLIMKLPDFPEANHPLVVPLQTYSDQALVQGFQQHPEEGKYFIALFCRFGAMSYALLRNMARSHLQVDYLFARVWRNIFYELNHLMMETGGPSFSLQAWVTHKVAACITEDQLPAIETIQYTLSTAPPPLWCYIQIALDHLPPLPRLILVLSQTFHWQDQRIEAVLQAEGQNITSEDINQYRQDAYRLLQEALPHDIQDIYFSAPSQPSLFSA